MSKLSDVVKNDVAKKTEYDESAKKVNNINNADTSDLVMKSGYNTNIGEAENSNYYQQKIIVFSKVECILQTMLDHKICLFINQHLIH